MKKDINLVEEVLNQCGQSVIEEMPMNKQSTPKKPKPTKSIIT
jgi:hypothetical protein